MKLETPRHNASSPLSTALVVAAAALFGLSAAQTLGDDPDPPMIEVSGDQLYNDGGGWFPDIPLQKWQPFFARLPAGAIFVDEGVPVTGFTATVIPPAATGVTLPPGRNPEVLFQLSGEGTQVDQPIEIAWPNVHDYPAGEVHLVYGYDPRVDEWRVCGAAVVGPLGHLLHQYDYTQNVTLSYYFVGEHPLVIE